MTSGPLSYMDWIAEARGCRMKGGEPDYLRVATIVLDEFRGGRIGRISLERPGDEVES